MELGALWRGRYGAVSQRPATPRSGHKADAAVVVVVPVKSIAVGRETSVAIAVGWETPVAIGWETSVTIAVGWETSIAVGRETSVAIAVGRETSVAVGWETSVAVGWETPISSVSISSVSISSVPVAKEWKTPIPIPSVPISKKRETWVSVSGGREVVFRLILSEEREAAISAFVSEEKREGHFWLFRHLDHLGDRRQDVDHTREAQRPSRRVGHREPTSSTQPYRMRRVQNGRGGVND